MPPFRQHVLICTQEPPEGANSCRGSGSLQLLQAFERELSSQGLDHEVQVTATGCLGVCDDGPIVIVYPQDVWYSKVRETDVPEFVGSLLRPGKPISRLAWSDSEAMKAKATEHRQQCRAKALARDEAGALPDDVDEMIRGFMPSRVILTALELDVFTAIEEGASAEQIARKIQTDPRATEMLLNALVSLRLLDKRDETFFDTPATARFLSEHSRDSARAALMHIANIWHRWSTLTDCVRSGTSAETRSPGWLKAFISAMDRAAQERVGAVVGAIGTAGIERMLDLGGGSGAYSIAFARAIPGLKAEILDLDDVIPLTQENIRQAGLADRVTARGGDLLQAPFGENYDLVLASNVCHAFSPEENRELFKRAFGALGPTGKMVVQDFILAPSKTAPRAAALFSLSMLAGTRAGSSYSEPEYRGWLKDAGFTEVRRVRPGGLMIGIRA
jgi:(2Fe-2S) ferredoxin/ubiquinone/menaquinone biosynthesis C-methylase UbiE